MAEEIVTLASIGNGAALELFDREMLRVIENIADVNTNPKTTREIHVRVLIKPDEDRTIGIATMEVTSKLAGVKPVNSVLYFGRDKAGKLVAVSNNIKQPSMFEDQENMRNVTPLSRFSGGGQGA